MGIHPQDDLFTLLRQVRTNQSDTGSQEQKWIINHLSDPKLRAMVPHLSIIALHILSALQTQNVQTGIALAESLGVTRGGITRAAKKLLQYGLVTTEKLPNNQKNIYYQLSPQGRTIAQVHDQMHQTLEQRFADKINAKYSAAELKIVTSFLNDVIKIESNILN
ncbi:MarR family transcriptional regulator [Limosilactobacillus caecicola]|uniref:MarR family transcriptional regulator n=1 Tax=Limosilactobacillus caecicola TaxID=2941332 RepID=UPI00203D9CCF|nr:MarR family transcriptional regulator [Limosilactobacillus caecicola]